jgi:hypothetical protein
MPRFWDPLPPTPPRFLDHRRRKKRKCVIRVRDTGTPEFVFGGRRRVTICIASYSLDNCFVAIADRKLSLVSEGHWLPGVDNATAKAFNIGWGWYGLAAGDMGVAIEIAECALGMLYRMHPVGLANRVQISRAFVGAFQKIRNLHIERQVLARFTITRRDFRRGRGARKSPYLMIAKKVDAFRLGVSLLLFGRDIEGFNHLLVVSDPGEIQEMNHLGYWAIGSGANTALAAMSVRWCERPRTYKDLIYRLCEAKFSCEGVDGIGQMTNMLFMNDWRGPLLELHPKYIDELRIFWERERRSPPPADALTVIDEAIREHLPPVR